MRSRNFLGTWILCSAVMIALETMSVAGSTPNIPDIPGEQSSSNVSGDFAVDQAFQDRFRDVASELRCPTCVGLSVLESDAPFSKQIKTEVTNQLRSGKSGDDILKFFTERYGPWILRSPPKDGVNILAWGIPLAMLVGGPVCVWFFIWRRRAVSAGIESTLPMEDILAAWERDIEAARAVAMGASLRSSLGESSPGGSSSGGSSSGDSSQGVAAGLKKKDGDA